MELKHKKYSNETSLSDSYARIVMSLIVYTLLVFPVNIMIYT